MLGMQCELMAVITLWLRIPVTYCVFASVGLRLLSHTKRGIATHC